MWSGVRLFGWYFWNKEKKKMKTISNAILSHDEMMDWFSDDTNHYLTQRDGNVVHVSPFVCDFEVVRDDEVVLRGVVGDGLGYDTITRKLKIIKRN
jgi:hypothetical protein